MSGGSLRVATGFSTTRNIITTQAGSNIVVDANQTYSIGGLISGSGGIVKSGTGSLTLTRANTFTGATTIDNGTVTAAAATGSALAATSSITVNKGGTLLLGASNQISDTAPVVLSGGTIAKGNFNEGSVKTPGFGALTSPSRPITHIWTWAPAPSASLPSPASLRTASRS